MIGINSYTIDDFFVFNKTSLGYLHISKGTVCQDYSLNYKDESCAIAIVADGHGNSACCRSDFGSRAVAEITLDEFKEFSKNTIQNDDLIEQIMLPRFRTKLIKSLTDTIISKWCKIVNEELERNPLTEEELLLCDKYRDKYEQGKHIEHVFGTTLIASLWIKDKLILIQQGDGHCNIFFENGEISQPIPWDERCYDNVTTSMCDNDASTSIRHHVIDLKETPVKACFLGTDGIEDSYIDLEGNYVFYKELMIKILEKEFDDKKLEMYLSEYLPVFSKRGSGDDISVAGIIFTCQLDDFAKSYSCDIESYNLKNTLNLYQSKLNSMQRKHKILEANKNNALDEFELFDKDYQLLLSKINELTSKINELNSENIETSENQILMNLEED